MIPAITTLSEQQSLYLEFLGELRASAFSGDISDLYADRVTLSTDNSIYQVLPQGAVYPKNIDDLVILAKLSQQPDFQKVVLTPRGGGTGTNAQSLTDGIVVDTSKHMNHVLEINQAERWARVQTGVVKDQLNAALKPYGLFFAPDLSTSNRATIGGMINTDASGQGSCLYGKTRDHVLSLTSVLLNGEVLKTHALSAKEYSAATTTETRSAKIHKLLDAIDRKFKPHIEKVFPKLNRCLTGYDLAHIREENGRLNLNNILCGSEGTLAFIAEAKVNLLPIPKCTALCVVKYSDFQSALRDAEHLMTAKPTSIETIDSKVLNLAMQDIVWQEVAAFFPPGKETVKGINLVEYTADSEDALSRKLDVFKSIFDIQKTEKSSTLGYSVANGRDAVNRVWKMRKKAVGLLGNSKGEARPIAFVEDTAVPPEHLADFIQEFRNILDRYNLDYGMFGHVDAGVLHVRPAIDMKDPEQEQLIRKVSDEVADLTQKYHGLLWGEHGKGVRSEYAPKFFGQLYPLLQKIKAAFDPHNQLNPGKIATPNDEVELYKIDEVATRGQADRLIPVQTWETFKEAVYCNGNGLCYNWDAYDAMCPSWKVTRERRHSPKGRASLMREWLRQLSSRNADPKMLLEKPYGLLQHIFNFPTRFGQSRRKQKGEYDFSHEVHEAMSGCLACKSCTGQCPIKVDVPTFRSQFLYLYYQRYCRPLKDYLVASLEFVLPIASKLPWIYNSVMGNKIVKKLLSKTFGFEDAPLLSQPSLKSLMAEHNIPYGTEANIQKLSPAEKKQAVAVVQDAFTTYFEAETVLDLTLFLKTLGYRPMLVPYRPNGKPLHVHGFLARFKRVAKKQVSALNAVASANIPLIGVDPSMTLTYRNEYAHSLEGKLPQVLLPQEWLATQKNVLAGKANLFHAGGEFNLLAHCSEKTNAAASIADWQNIFKWLGQQLTPTATGCCGMAGTYGHERQNKANSAKLFDMSWSGIVNDSKNLGKLVVTGYSCRAQTKREAFTSLPHPVSLLLGRLKQKT